MIDSMKCTCGKLMTVPEVHSYGGRCEECWLRGFGVDMRGKFVEGSKGAKGNSSNGRSQKVWPKVGS